MKTKDLKKLAKKADEILKEKTEKYISLAERVEKLKKIIKAGLIKKPKSSLFIENICPKCKHILIFTDTCLFIHYSCPNCDYEYGE